MIKTWRGVIVTTSIFGFLSIVLVFAVVGMSGAGWALITLPPLVAFAAFMMLDRFVERTRFRLFFQAAVWIILFAAIVVILLLI